MLAIHVQPASATMLEPGPLTHAAGAAAVTVASDELYDPGLVAFRAVDDLEDLQPGPLRTVDDDPLRTCPRVPGAPEVVVQSQRER
jgi:hypothetical protein